jgi:SNF2 family DNA or RNA helicase
MGLGKTLQTISYFAYLKENHHISKAGPHLVVVPLSVLFNWVAEMKKFCPTLRILRLHTNNSTESIRLRDVINAADSYDVLITTYEMIKGSMEVTMRRILWTSMILDGE